MLTWYFPVLFYLAAGAMYFIADFERAVHVAEQYIESARTPIILFLMAVVISTWPFWLALKAFKKLHRWLDS